MEQVTGDVLAPRTLDGGRGVSWWSDGWALFMKNPGMWIVLGLLLFVIFVVLSVIPLIGWLASSLATPVFIGSWMIAARKVDGGGPLEIGDLFSGFQERAQPLLLLGAIFLGVTVVIVLVLGALGAGAAFGMMMSSGHSSGAGVAAAMGAGMLGLLLTLGLSVLFAMAIWFAPALVVFRNVPPFDAVKASFAASLKNIVPFLLYGLIYLVAAVVAMIPFGLGWVVLVPVGLLTMYVSYKDVFGG
ncbi:MAG TPA: BPSS1780 family membrane protein [Albitalea sp.]|uniref:BPSS1780 family membrane protein n=1 Tax=Piscinibacter sp. TaxID=1903157 RepID=UPI002ED67ADF